MEKNKQLFSLYTKAADYIGFNDMASNAYDIIQESVNTLKDTKFVDLYERCVMLVNMWEETTLEDIINKSEWLIEDISGSLAEYFCD